MPFQNVPRHYATPPRWCNFLVPPAVRKQDASQHHPSHPPPYPSCSCRELELKIATAGGGPSTVTTHPTQKGLLRKADPPPASTTHLSPPSDALHEQNQTSSGFTYDAWSAAVHRRNPTHTPLCLKRKKERETKDGFSILGHKTQPRSTFILSPPTAPFLPRARLNLATVWESVHHRTTALPVHSQRTPKSIQTENYALQKKGNSQPTLCWFPPLRRNSRRSGTHVPIPNW